MIKDFQDNSINVIDELSFLGKKIYELDSLGTLRVSMLEEELNKFMKETFGTSKFHSERSIHLPVPPYLSVNCVIEIEKVKRVESLKTNDYVYSFQGRVLSIKLPNIKADKYLIEEPEPIKKLDLNKFYS